MVEKMKHYTIYESIIGDIYIVAENDAVVGVHIGKDDFTQSESIDTIKYDKGHPILEEAVKQFSEYFSGTRKEFNLPLKEEGTPFQSAVWQQLKKIPYGETLCYQDVAAAIGNERAVRAIGQANKANRLPIIIPCHRVIGKNKTLTGYAGKRVNIKEQLLLIEGAQYKN
jgi:methylated-DNA-[protein]-cysteine S-methyltransferase